MTPLTFVSQQTQAEAEFCARMMAASDPWLTLGQDFDGLLNALQNPARTVFLAKADAEIAGMVLINMHGAFRGYLQSVCVAPAWRNQRVGAALMAFAESFIFHQTPNVFLCVSSFNLAAQKFYQREGYEEVGILKDYLVMGYDEILMRKTRGALVDYRPTNLRLEDPRPEAA
jgi:ribosomal protein S18 acetylase RimI-like enzyme